MTLFRLLDYSMIAAMDDIESNTHMHNLSTLSQLFDGDEWPTFESLETPGNTQALINLYTDERILWFEGHFPEQAVLAGVVQTHWAAELGKHLFPLGEDFQQLGNLKFQAVILPNQSVTLALDYKPETNSLSFKYYDDETNYSEGKFQFGNA